MIAKISTGSYVEGMVKYNHEKIKEVPEELSWLKNREKLIRKPLFELVIFIIKEFLNFFSNRFWFRHSSLTR